MSLRLSVKLLAALVAFVVLAFAAVAFIGISIDAQRWREPVAAMLSRALGREVRLEGPARLALSLRPEVLVRDIRIANPPRFDSPDFARIGELRLGVELLPLLRGETRVRELHGRDVVVRLARSSDGRGNWIFDARATDMAAAREPSNLPGLEVHRVALEKVLIDYVGRGATRRFELTELTGEARAGQSSRLSARGMVDKELPYTAEATAAPLSALGGAEPWPFEFTLRFPGTVLNASGTLSGSLHPPVARMVFGAGTADTREVGAAAGHPASAALAQRQSQASSTWRPAPPR